MHVTNIPTVVINLYPTFFKCLIAIMIDRNAHSVDIQEKSKYRFIK